MALTKITTDIIADGAITSDKLASGAVSASSLTSITTDNVSEGSTNLYFTNARADARIAAATTDDLTEGSTNLYFTNARIDSHLSGGTGVTYSSGAISIGQDVSTTATPTFGNITTTGYIAGPATFTIDPAAVGDNTGTVVIAGNLQVDGTTTTINSTTVNVDDLNIQLATGAINAAAADGAGITVDGASATITYDGTNDEWDFNKPLTVSFSGDKGITAASSNSHASIYVDSAASSSQYIRMTENGTNNYWIQADSSGKLNFRPAGGSSETTKVVFDSAGNVGIGTYSPSVQLHVKSSATTYAQARIETGADGYDASVAYAQAGTIKGISGYDDSTDTVAIKYGTFGGNGIDIDSSGNVGIGTSSPNNLLTLEDGDLQIHETSTSDPLIQLSVGGTQASPTQSWVLRVDNSDSDKFQLLDQTDSRVVLTADGSGNLLVGQTTASDSTAGFYLSSAGRLSINRDGGFPLRLNRLTSDGDLISFNKDSSSVGSISTTGGDIFVGTGNTGIRFVDASTSIQPINTSTGARTDNTIDLGSGTYRFKDLYLSGTITAGGLTINTSASQYLQWNDTAATVLSYYVGSTSITASTTTDIVTFNGGANHYAAYDLTIYSNDSAAPAGLELTRMTILVQTNASSVTRSAMTIVDQTSTYASGTGNLAFSVSASGTDLILTVTESDGDARGLRVFVNSEFWSANRYGGATII